MKESFCLKKKKEIKISAWYNGKIREEEEPHEGTVCVSVCTCVYVCVRVCVCVRVSTCVHECGRAALDEIHTGDERAIGGGACYQLILILSK